MFHKPSSGQGLASICFQRGLGRAGKGLALGCVFKLDVPGWPAASRAQLCQPEVLHAFPPTLQLPTSCRESTLCRLVGNTQHVKCAAVALCMAMRKTGVGERQSPGTKAAAHMFRLLKGLDSTTLVVRTQDRFSRLRE